jgi:DNA repair ATPase RecN
MNLRRRIDEEQAEQIKNYNAKLKEYEDSISNSTKAIDKLEKELENNFDSLDVDEYEQKLEEIELLKNVDSPVRRKLRELDNSHTTQIKTNRR